MRNFVNIIFAVIMLTIASGCKKKETEVDITPIISVASLTPSIIKENTDSLTMIINYEDGDGDLGENSSSAKNLYITDKRINITSTYRISALAPAGSTIHIKGSVKLVLTKIPIINGSSNESLSYDVYVIDRAGHKSNTVTTSTVTVTK